MFDGSINTSVVHITAGEIGDMLDTVNGVEEDAWALNCWWTCKIGVDPIPCNEKGEDDGGFDGGWFCG